jgi:hypothetical protein
MDATSRTDVYARSFLVKKTWFHGLAMTLGVTAIPSVATAQYSISGSDGLAASSFNAKALPPPVNSAVRNYMAPQSQTSLAAYSQGGAVGSGLPGGHIHVPATENPVLSTQYQSETPYALQEGHAYEQMRIPPAPTTHPTYPAPAATPMQSGMSSGMSSGISSCPACNSGHCPTHGVMVGGGPATTQIVSPAPMTYGASESCYSEPSISCGPSIVSPNKWIFGASALYFNRLDNQDVTLTTNTSDGAMPSPTPNPYVQSFLRTSDARMEATGGVQLSAGRYFGDGRYALMGTYWGIFSNPQSATILASSQVNGNLRSNLPFALRGPTGNFQYGIEMPTGPQSVYDWYDSAFAHRILRDQEFHSAEVNFFSFALGGGARQAYAANDGCYGGGRIGYGSGAVRSMARGYGAYGGNCGTNACADPCQTVCEPCSGPTGPCAPWYGAQCSKLRLNMYGGVRWFRFRDSLEYAASANNNVFNNEADDFYYRNKVTNDLVGFQLGALGTWCTGTRINFFGGTNFGIYGNHINARTSAGTATETAVIVSPDLAFDNRPYDYTSSRDDIAFLGEGTLGTGVRITRGWTGNVAYRLVGVTGVANSVGQIPRDFSRGDEITRINNNYGLLLHGVSFGANYNF